MVRCEHPNRCSKQESRVTAANEVIDLIALCRVRGVSWHFVARQAQRPGGLAGLLAGEPAEKSLDAAEAVQAIEAERDALPRHREIVAAMLEELNAEGVRLTTVLDDEYPVNLRLIYNLPPFLTFRGALQADDARSVAVVGTREASVEGVASARRLAAQLVEAGVTVLSGLARGIDTAAHEAALEAGGRTIAVMGTGIRLVYPPENAALAERIASTGALVSQFWPDSPPARYSFPRRNVVMSGMGQGTVVVEASATSGAKLQARYALEHGKRVFLLSSLVRDRPWARGYLKRGAIEVRSVDDIVRMLQSPKAVQARSDQRRQLTLALG
ncbi:MAG: DNA-protecting protein DprA [Anaerolinea sp.]|jgi:DNA processing protein|nr:DNA-protecting protein DprA [Anaerolinea sp.]